MAAGREGYDTDVADYIDRCVSQIHCHCQWQFMNYDLTSLNCHHPILGSQIGHPVLPFTQSSVNFCSSRSSANNDGGKLI